MILFAYFMGLLGGFRAQFNDYLFYLGKPILSAISYSNSYVGRYVAYSTFIPILCVYTCSLQMNET